MKRKPEVYASVNLKSMLIYFLRQPRFLVNLTESLMRYVGGC